MKKNSPVSVARYSRHLSRSLLAPPPCSCPDLVEVKHGASSVAPWPSCSLADIDRHAADHAAILSPYVAHGRKLKGASSSETWRNGGEQQKQVRLLFLKEIMRSLAEMMLCCDADCGCALQLWRMVVLRKWLNVGAGSGDSDFSADDGDTTEG